MIPIQGSSQSNYTPVTGSTSLPTSSESSPVMSNSQVLNLVGQDIHTQLLQNPPSVNDTKAWDELAKFYSLPLSSYPNPEKIKGLQKKIESSQKEIRTNSTLLKNDAKHESHAKDLQNKCDALVNLIEDLPALVLGFGDYPDRVNNLKKDLQKLTDAGQYDAALLLYEQFTKSFLSEKGAAFDLYGASSENTRKLESFLDRENSRINRLNIDKLGQWDNFVNQIGEFETDNFKKGSLNTSTIQRLIQTSQNIKDKAQYNINNAYSDRKDHVLELARLNAQTVVKSQAALRQTLLSVNRGVRDLKQKEVNREGKNILTQQDRQKIESAESRALREAQERIKKENLENERRKSRE